MSTPSQPDPRVDQPAMTDETLLSVHEKMLGTQPDAELAVAAVARRRR